MKNSSASYKTKNIIFIILLTTLSIILMVSIVFLILAIKKEKKLENAIKEKSTDLSKVKKQRSIDLKTRKYNLKSEVIELTSEIKKCLDMNNTFTILQKKFETKVRPHIQNRNVDGVNKLMHCGYFYFLNKQEVESVIEIVLLCIKNFFQRKDPKLLKYLIKYFSIVFKDLKTDLDKEMMSIREYCIAEKNTRNLTEISIEKFRCLIEDINYFILASLFDPILTKVYLQILNKKSVNQEYLKEYKFIIIKLDFIVLDLFNTVKNIIDVEIKVLKLDKNIYLNNVMRNIQKQEANLKEKIISDKYELFNQYDTKEILKCFIFYVILIQSHLNNLKRILIEFTYTKDRFTFINLNKLDLINSSDLIIEIFVNVFEISVRMIENTKYNVKKDIEVINENHDKIIANKELCGRLLEL